MTEAGGLVPSRINTKLAGREHTADSLQEL